MLIYSNVLKKLSFLNQTISTYLKTGVTKEELSLNSLCGKHFGEESNEVQLLKQIKLYEALPPATLETSESGADLLTRSSTLAKQNFNNMWEFVQSASEYQGQEFIFKSKSPKKRYIQVIA